MDRRARAAGVSMGQVCDAAGIARSTFYRWKRSNDNPKPISATLASLNKMEVALGSYEQRPPDRPDWELSEQEIAAIPEDRRVIVCDVCERRVDGEIPNACTFVDCPHAQRIAA